MGISLRAKNSHSCLVGSHSFVIVHRGVLYPGLHEHHFGDLGQYVPACWAGYAARARGKVYLQSIDRLSPALVGWWHRDHGGDQLVSAVFGWMRQTHWRPQIKRVGSQRATRRPADPESFCCADSARCWEVSHPGFLSALTASATEKC